MSSTDVQRPVKVHDSCVKSVSQESEKHARRSTIHSGIPASKKKHDDGRFKFGRKRAQSFTAGNGKFFIPYKKRKRESIVPPTKFLLGGNIFDPLNLNSLQDEEINRAMNAVTPKSSPLPTPKHRRGEVEVLIPPNINDPLNLIDCDDDAKYEEQLVSPTKKKSKKKKKKRNSSSSKDDSLEVAVASNTADQSVSSVKTEENEPEAPVNTSIEVVSEIPEQSVTKGKEIRDLRKELELPLKDEEKKPRKSLDEKDANKHEKKNRKFDLKDKIVSPVIPQPGAWKRQPHGHRGGGNMGHGAGDGRFNRFRPGGRQRPKIPGLNIAQTPKFQEKNVKFQYGNYNRYYGYRNPSHELDPRLKYFQQRREIFYDKDVLDIGCNIGHVTLTIARDFGAKSVVGLDIDRSLVEIARVNVRHYVNYADSPPNEGATGRFFPISMPILYGPVDIPGITKSDSPSGHKKFPHNVSFVQGNYVLDSDVLLQTEQPQFDVILALSITKWIHLNWGDAGLKRAFKRMFLQLRPGGKLILEAQAWDSYKKKKKLTETIFKYYNSIEFFPDKFTQYLLSAEVGFSKCEVIGLPFHQSRGFQRPIQLFTKGESPMHSVTSTSHTPCYSSGTNATRVPVYTSVVSSSRETESGGATPAPIDTGNSSTSGLVDSTVNQQIPIYTSVAMPEQTGELENSKGKKIQVKMPADDLNERVTQREMPGESSDKCTSFDELSGKEVANKMKCPIAENGSMNQRDSSGSSVKMECKAIEKKEIKKPTSDVKEEGDVPELGVSSELRENLDELKEKKVLYKEECMTIQESSINEDETFGASLKMECDTTEDNPLSLLKESDGQLRPSKTVFKEDNLVSSCNEKKPEDIPFGENKVSETENPQDGLLDSQCSTSERVHEEEQCVSQMDTIDEAKEVTSS